MLTYVLCLLQVCYKRRLKTGRLLAASEAQWASVIGYRDLSTYVTPKTNVSQSTFTVSLESTLET